MGRWVLGGVSGNTDTGYTKKRNEPSLAPWSSTQGSERGHDAKGAVDKNQVLSDVRQARPQRLGEVLTHPEGSWSRVDAPWNLIKVPPVHPSE